MSMADELAKSCSDKNFATIFKIIAGKQYTAKFAEDGMPLSGIAHTDSEVAEMRALQYEAVKARHVEEFGGYTTLAEQQSSARADFTKAVRAAVKDGFANPITNIGTDVDPYNYTTALHPTLAGPEEATAMYASGGVAGVIIDKKAKGALVSGYSINSPKFSPMQLKELRDYASSIGFEQAMVASMRDGLLYGGAYLFPTLARETPVTYEMTVPQLFASGMLHKGCLQRFNTVDRWNSVVVPNYDICAQDYLRPRTFYVPLSGIEVHTSRCAKVIQHTLPYWGAIRQLGWGVSDLVSYVRSLTGYEIMAMSLPIMCQQMSLLVHELPLDGIIAQNGVKAAKKWQKENEEEMRKWSILNPVAINSFGTLSVLNRSYTGFGELVDAVRKDVSAKSGLPESVIFFSQPNGIFNKSEEDVLLKQSETIRLGQKTVTPELNRMLPFLAASYFGCETWEQWLEYSTLQLSFDSPVVTSPSQESEIALRYAQAVSMLTGSGLSVDKAVGFMSTLMGEVKIPEEASKLLSTPVANVGNVSSEATQNQEQSEFGVGENGKT